MKKLLGIALVALMTLVVDAANGQTVVRSGFNIFSVDQDVEIGRQSALQVEKQMPMLSNAAVSRYVSNIGARLASQAPGSKFAYQFKVVDVSEVNAFALPGGFIYVNRGLLSKARTEGELAGVMAHEIAHVALRHPTNQASKAYLAQAGLGILGGLMGGKSQSSTSQIVGAIGGFGMNTLFLKFSRSIESQADVVGAQIMSRAGYDPIEMSTFFGYLAQQAGGDPSKFATFLSDHPAPADREARVRQEAGMLGPVHRSATTGNLQMIQRLLGSLPAAPTATQLAQYQNPNSRPSADEARRLSIELPSSRYHVFQQAEGVYQLDQPDNWDAYVASGGYGVTIVPHGGFATASSGRQDISYGVIVNHYVPFDGAVGSHFVDPNESMFGRTPLDEATSDLVRNILASNPYLARRGDPAQSQSEAGHPTMSVTLVGRSPGTGLDERVTVIAQQLPDEHVIYMLLIAPAMEYAALTPTFDHMARSFRSDEHGTHH